LITASVDGYVKFWKKAKQGIEFVKTFKAHLGSIVKISASDDGLLLATISKDTTMKVYDIINFGESNAHRDRRLMTEGDEFVSREERTHSTHEALCCLFPHFS
jgi:WD40 repeat protein